MSWLSDWLKGGGLRGRLQQNNEPTIPPANWSIRPDRRRIGKAALPQPPTPAKPFRSTIGHPETAGKYPRPSSAPESPPESPFGAEWWSSVPGWWAADPYTSLTRHPFNATVGDYNVWAGDFLTPFEFEAALYDPLELQARGWGSQIDLGEGQTLGDWVRSYSGWYRNEWLPAQTEGYSPAEVELWSPSYAPPEAGAGGVPGDLEAILAPFLETLTETATQGGATADRLDEFISSTEALMANQGELWPILIGLLQGQTEEEDYWGGSGYTFYPGGGP